MERVISDEEKIRRAIEISQRRNQNYYINDTARVNLNNKKDYKLFKRMILQIIICLLIYLIFYLVSTTNYVFSDQIIKTTNSILNYDINLEKIYKDCQQFLTTMLNNSENKVINDNFNQMQENNNLSESNIVEENKKDEKKEEVNTKEVGKQKTQMEQDAETVKTICKFQKPLSGTITSGFGEREVTSKVMSADHKGIDIATKIGTSIKAAMDGTVSIASKNNDYGNFIKIINKDVMTVYAHCEKLKVKEGDKVKMGDTIATVGSTGNSTGPHLHFEIRLSDRYINPELIIKFR